MDPAASHDESQLRLITCGSVGDGKSTLVGRLLFEAGALFDDQLSAVAADSLKWGTPGANIDSALFVDGPEAEREQAITSDVAYRYFSSGRRKYIVADTPGHDPYTANMVIGASTADLALILLDVRKGLLPQTKRDTRLCQLMGIRHVVLVVNKMDLVAFSQVAYNRIDEAYRDFAASINLGEVTSIPLSALHGDNVVRPSARTPWYSGPAVLQLLEQLELDVDALQAAPLRLPVQWVNRPHADFRGYSGRIVSGQVRPGDRVTIQPSGRHSVVARIVDPGGDLSLAVAGESVTLTLRDELDVSRGDLISGASDPAPLADQFECNLVWLGEAPLLPGRPYLLKIGSCTVGATVTVLRHKLNIETQEQLAARTLELNDIGNCHLVVDRALPFEPCERNREMGAFILVDRSDNKTVGAGMLLRALGPALSVPVQAQQVSLLDRQRLTHHGSAVLWFTGLSGAGKSTIANRLAWRLQAAGVLSYVLDGDNIRHGLSRDLGFSDADRVENIRRAAEVARLMVDAGVMVISAFISPFEADRQLARTMFASDAFIEVHIHTPIEVAESRDTKGLYRLARLGKLENFTGIDSAYEEPRTPDVRIDTTTLDVEAAAGLLHRELIRRGLLPEPAP